MQKYNKIFQNECILTSHLSYLAQVTLKHPMACSSSAQLRLRLTFEVSLSAGNVQLCQEHIGLQMDIQPLCEIRVHTQNVKEVKFGSFSVSINPTSKGEGCYFIFPLKNLVFQCKISLFCQAQFQKLSRLLSRYMIYVFNLVCCLCRLELYQLKNDYLPQRQ